MTSNVQDGVQLWQPGLLFAYVGKKLPRLKTTNMSAKDRDGLNQVHLFSDWHCE